MSDQRKKIATELDRLHREGSAIFTGAQVRYRPQEEREELIEAIRKAKKAASKAKKGRGKDDGAEDSAIVKLIESDDFGGSFQRWYSTAIRVVEQMLPDRYGEFRELYRLERKPKTLEVTTYTISDYIHGTRVPREGIDDVTARSIAMTKMKDQLDILASASDRVDSILADIEGSLEATLLDDELESANQLLKAKHLRSAGVVVGVVLERHLKSVAANHRVSLGGKKAQLGTINDALKKAKVFDNPRWREIQRMADLRNLCAHDGERAPTRDDVQELIEGAERIVKTVF